jgi:uncharacterized protein YcbX
MVGGNDFFVGESNASADNSRMQLTEIWIFPVKSLCGVRVAKADVEERGLRYDRRWMIVDENGVFITQRKLPKMTLITVSFSPNGLILSHRGQSSRVLVPYWPVSSQCIQVQVWKDACTAFTVTDEADAWLTRILEKPVRIVEMRESNHRSMTPAFSNKGELLSFADDFPYHLISEASLADLNSKLKESVGMGRFRPNFVVGGAEPFAEDRWKRIQIGNTHFELVSPCERCVVTAIDTATGEKGTEPLKTLSTYRKVDRKILFGQNLISLKHGTVQEGDDVGVML